MIEKEGTVFRGKRKPSRRGEKVCGWPKLRNDRGGGGRRRRSRRWQALGCKSKSDGRTKKKEECRRVRRDHREEKMGGRFKVDRALQF